MSYGKGLHMAKSASARENLAALVKRAQAGDRNAFEELYRRTAQAQYFTIVGRVGESAAADILQEVYLIAWRNVGKIRPQAVLGYLSATARNLCLQHFQQRSRMADAPVTDEGVAGAGVLSDSAADEVEPAPGDGTAAGFAIGDNAVRGELVAQSSGLQAQDPARVLSDTDRRQRLARALLEDLTDRERDAVLMRYYLDMKVNAIAEQMDVSRNTVRNLINSALATLRRKVGVLPMGAGLSAALSEAVEARMAPDVPPRVRAGSGLKWATRAAAAVTVAAALGALGFAATWQPPESVADEPVPMTEPEPEVVAASAAAGPELASTEVVDGLLVLEVRDAAGVAEAWCVGDDGAVFRPVSTEESSSSASIWRFEVPSGTYEVHVVNGAGTEAMGNVTADVPPIYPAPSAA